MKVDFNMIQSSEEPTAAEVKMLTMPYAWIQKANTWDFHGYSRPSVSSVPEPFTNSPLISLLAGTSSE